MNDIDKNLMMVLTTIILTIVIAVTGVVLSNKQKLDAGLIPSATWVKEKQ